MAERVVVKHEPTTTGFIFSDYQDWNNPLNKIEAFYAGKIVEKRNRATVRELTTVETETGNVYVVMPVPASVQKAITPTAQRVAWVRPSTGPQTAQDQQTPRMANGKPDLAGNWIPSGNPSGRYGSRRCGPTQDSECSRQINQTEDYELYSPSRYGPSRPTYKPEFWDKIQQLDMWTNKEGPVMTCQPL